MRYLTQMSAGPKRFNNGSTRPALEKLPPALADKLREYDRVMAQRQAAQVRVNELGGDELTRAAQQKDDDAATKAARAGKPIPAPSALPKLEQERADAARALQAQSAAFTTVTTETDDLASSLYWSGLEDVTARRITLRAELAAKANAVADAIEQAVDEFAVHDWLRGDVYDRTTRTWPTEVMDLERHGLARNSTTPVNVRDILVAAAITVLDDPTN